MQPSHTRQTWYFAMLLGFLFTVFFWLLTRFVEAVYTLGLLGVEIPPEIASVALLLSPLVLVAFPGLLAGKQARRLTQVCMAGALLCQGVTPLLPTRVCMLVSGLGVGLFLVGLPGFWAGWSMHALSKASLGGGLMVAGLFSVALRTLNSGNGPLGGSFSLAINWLIVISGLVLLLVRFPGADDQPATTGRTVGFWRGVGLSLGLFGALGLLYYGFNAPTVIARWTGGSYAWVNGLIAGSLLAFSGLWMGWTRFRNWITPRVLRVWGALFVLALAAALLPYQVAFPADPAAYPVDAVDPGSLPQIALALALILHPVIYAAFAHLAGALIDDRPAPRALAGAAVLAALFLLVMIFAQVLTTVYDYIPVVGPLLRDRFWLVTLTPGVVMALALLQASPPKRENPRQNPLWLGSLLLVVFIPVLWAGVPRAQPGPPAQDGVLRVMTYNIQQGYDVLGENAYSDLLEAIRLESPDILGLQETDTARIANGNGDVVRYLADGLEMDSYYGPNSVTGTFGIALLSSYPIENPRSFFMYSKGEQTAAIQAEVRVDGQVYHILITHLGNGGPLVQQQQVLSRIDGLPNLIAMGDFNFNPSKEQYRLTTVLFNDAWEAAGEKVTLDPGFDLTRRIDHVFLSRELAVSRAKYLPRGVSDHPALVVDILLK